MRERQRAKIRQFGDALAAMGLRTLDKQADALALSRSTTWNLLKGKHKGSGISPTIINRMLASPRLPPRVRATILEYVAEKAAGRRQHERQHRRGCDAGSRGLRGDAARG